jgi:glycosyl transferase family 25
MSTWLNNIFVIHVSEGYEERKKHIDAHLPERGFSQFTYMLDGDIKDITPNVKNKYFNNITDMGAISCFYKHLLVYQNMVENKIESALIFEDDVFLRSNSLEVLTKLSAELEHESNFIVNIESPFYTVPKSVQNKGQMLYLAKETKRTGGYVIDLIAATKIVNYLNANTTNLPIDTFQSALRETLKYNIFWIVPPIVTQGSKNGMFHSELSCRRKSYFKFLTSIFRDVYQEYVASNLSKKRKAVFDRVVKYK